MSHKHLDYYLDEFTFRFNRRKSMSRGELFYRLVQQAVAIEPVTLDEIPASRKEASSKLATTKGAGKGNECYCPSETGSGRIVPIFNSFLSHKERPRGDFNPFLRKNRRQSVYAQQNA